MRRKSAKISGALLALASVLGASAVLGAPVSIPPPVSTPDGKLQGVERDGIVAYLGVPYAQPPVGDLRWRPPQKLSHWSGVRLARQFGNDCMQARRRPARGAQTPLSEDCLYLNVWAPAGRAPQRWPVMVWVHGGGFFAGSGSQPLYQGADLAQRGVVVVTLNYRLGRFGFFAHPALLRENPSEPIGNYGLMDQIAALRWVKRNIAAFGGDPKKVTLFGQSAGGASVSDLMASPYARGLFERAIIESGIFANPATSLEQAEAAGEAAAMSWGLTNPDASALRGVPADEVLGGGAGLAARTGPMIDGKVLPQDATEAFEAGKVVRVPLIIGSNSYEAGFFPAMARGLSRRLAAEWPKVEAAFDGYGTHQTAAIEGELATDMMITAPTWRLARAAARDGLPTYLYYFSYLRPSEQGRMPGPSHIDEVYAVFDHMRLVEHSDGAETQRIVDEIESRWVQFARTGHPTLDKADWPAITPQSFKLLEFANGGPVVRGDFAGERLELASALAADALAPPPRR
jgi:para-nitrobenzyl esterase